MKLRTLVTPAITLGFAAIWLACGAGGSEELSGTYSVDQCLHTVRPAAAQEPGPSASSGSGPATVTIVGNTVTATFNGRSSVDYEMFSCTGEINHAVEPHLFQPTCTAQTSEQCLAPTAPSTMTIRRTESGLSLELTVVHDHACGNEYEPGRWIANPTQGYSHRYECDLTAAP